MPHITARDYTISKIIEIFSIFWKELLEPEGYIKQKLTEIGDRTFLCRFNKKMMNKLDKI